MAQVEITINGRTYKVMCDDGQEGRLRQLAHYFDRHVAQHVRDLGQIGDARLMLLAALTVCDELFECKKRIMEFGDSTKSLDEETMGGAARVIDAAAKRIESMAEKVGRV